ncbi:MAG: type II toxin-antitoxin system VapC family toxin [Alphaproteobacteria bacterium]
MREIFVDTSALYALFAARDRNHATARAALDRMRQSQASLVTSDVVLLETHVLVHARTGSAGLLRFRSVVGRSRWLRTVEVSPPVAQEAWSLVEARVDNGYSFVDATSFVLMRLLGIDEAFSFDDHFRQEGFVMLPGKRNR